jgi:hypothetical protein
MSDELLMAYADGVLDPAARAGVEVAIRSNPEYRKKVERFRATRSPVQEAFREALRSSRLEPLIDRIRGEEVQPSADPDASHVVWISGNKAKAYKSGFRQHLPIAMAASVTFMIGGALGWSLHTGKEGVRQHAPTLVAFSNGGLVAQGALQELLEHASSGSPITAEATDGKTWELKANFTFRSTSQSPCRRYEISSAGAARFAGYACRSGEGQWFVNAHTGLATKVAQSRGFAPAGGDADAALDAAIRSVMDGDVYQSTEERELIASGWSTARQ